MKDSIQDWWRNSVVYQIYPKSFNDTTGNGVGDIQGIIEKLDYLDKLGIDVIWLTPIYDSPQNDNGYDIRDYYSIYKEYGTMNDFNRLLDEAHQRDIKVIMDIVINHTSTEHEWFKEARKSKDNKYRDFYIWKDGNEGQVPNNWKSKFGGSAWKYDEQTGQYYLHLFDVTQADLNWENEEVRDKLYEMMNFWLDEKGVDGFRLDVINLISKREDFPDDYQGDGRRFYTDGPRVHEFMKEMNQEVFSNYDMMTVGEMSSTNIDDCVKYTNPNRNELDMVFNFYHLKVDYPNGKKWIDVDFDFLQLKDILSKWQVGMNQGGGWNALFWCNHDQPRVVTRFGDDQKYHTESAKMLATTIHLMRGTPYIYQGEEIGMTDPKFDSIDDYRDVESLNAYEIMKEEGKEKEEIMDAIRAKSRDNSRTPMQWDDSQNAGFTSGTPWIDVAPNYKEINVEAALADKNSIFYYYQKLINLRKDYDIIVDGDYQLILDDHEDIFAYLRSYKTKKLLVINNFYDTETTFKLPAKLENLVDYNSKILISNYDNAPAEFKNIQLRPYESVVYYLEK